jgi:arylsulfatase A-like enzyme
VPGPVRARKAAILTGKYSHSTGVWTNSGTHGGFNAFGSQDSSTIATWLHAGGYHTVLVGKYLNGYTRKKATYIPPVFSAQAVHSGAAIRECPTELPGDPSAEPERGRRLGQAGVGSGSPPSKGNWDANRKKQEQSLLAVDDAVGHILAALQQTRRLQDSLIFFAGDNGLSEGRCLDTRLDRA